MAKTTPKLSTGWNSIDYIYNRKGAPEIHKLGKGADGHRVGGMFKTRVS